MLIMSWSRVSTYELNRRYFIDSVELSTKSSPELVLYVTTYVYARYWLAWCYVD